MTIKKMDNRKGVSPVIATVLLVTMVVVIALIIFLWFRNINKEAITKFDGTNVEIVCSDVSFDASYSSGTLYVTNSGNVPIYSMKLRTYSGGSYETNDLHDLSASGWPEKGLNPGIVSSSSGLSGYIEGAERTILIPVLVGVNEAGEQKLHTCEDSFGQEIDRQ